MSKKWLEMFFGKYPRLKTKKIEITLTKKDLDTLKEDGSVVVPILFSSSPLSSCDTNKATSLIDGTLEVEPSVKLAENGKIGYNLARMAKKAGYPQLCYPFDNSIGYYDGNGELSPYLCFDEGSCLCCSQSQLQQWIRREYKIHIQVIIDNRGWHCKVFGIDILPDHYVITNYFYTYESALEEALFEVLKMIIAEKERIKTKKK